MTSIIDYVAMQQKGKDKEFFNLHYKRFLFKHIDDSRLKPIVKEMMQEEIIKLNTQAQKCYVLEKNQEAKRLEEQIEIYQEIVNNINV